MTDPIMGCEDLLHILGTWKKVENCAQRTASGSHLRVLADVLGVRCLVAVGNHVVNSVILLVEGCLHEVMGDLTNPVGEGLNALLDLLGSILDILASLGHGLTQLGLDLLVNGLLLGIAPGHVVVLLLGLKALLHVLAGLGTNLSSLLAGLFGLVRHHGGDILGVAVGSLAGVLGLLYSVVLELDGLLLGILGLVSCHLAGILGIVYSGVLGIDSLLGGVVLELDSLLLGIFSLLGSVVLELFGLLGGIICGLVHLLLGGKVSVLGVARVGVSGEVLLDSLLGLLAGAEDRVLKILGLLQGGVGGRCGGVLDLSGLVGNKVLGLLNALRESVLVLVTHLV
mmetsp:Transcript_7184/g.14397  ORF Transcript_7184/g.14397 Transcript_7184/m.14397 type:complete len:340 (-) Transcript_7184:215-1234(-)